jgi:uncharacterized protein YqeY
MIREEIHQQMIQAMRQKNQAELETLRYLWSEIKNQEIDNHHELSDEEVVQVVKREVKRRREAIEQFRAGGRVDLVSDEQDKLKIIERYLPQQLSRDQIEQIVDEVLQGSQSDFGNVMKQVMEKAQGQADGKLVAEVVRSKLV